MHLELLLAARAVGAATCAASMAHAALPLDQIDGCACTWPMMASGSGRPGATMRHPCSINLFAR